MSSSAHYHAGQDLDGRYKLLELIGSGGYGSVFRAEQIDIGRIVAVKIFHTQEESSDEFFLERYQREAQALSSLAHMNVVTVYHAAFTESMVPYLVMELIDGKKACSLLKEDDLSKAISVALKSTEGYERAVKKYSRRRSSRLTQVADFMESLNAKVLHEANEKTQESNSDMQ